MIFLIIVLAYVLSHGSTAWAVTPVQSLVLPEVTVFASLMYLPHGVRVLATWAYGWKAIPALIAGAALSTYFFSPPDQIDFLSPALLESLLIGAVCAFLAFELVRLAGYNCYFGQSRKLPWKGMIAIGTLSSVINSIGQTFIFSGLIGLGDIRDVLLVYAIGDLVGLIVCMVLLMFVFRWGRRFGSPI